MSAQPHRVARRTAMLAGMAMNTGAGRNFGMAATAAAMNAGAGVVAFECAMGIFHAAVSAFTSVQYGFATISREITWGQWERITAHSEEAHALAQATATFMFMMPGMMFPILISCSAAEIYPEAERARAAGMVGNRDDPRAWSFPGPPAPHRRWAQRVAVGNDEATGFNGYVHGPLLGRDTFTVLAVRHLFRAVIFLKACFWHGVGNWNNFTEGRYGALVTVPTHGRWHAAAGLAGNIGRPTNGECALLAALIAAGVPAALISVQTIQQLMLQKRLRIFLNTQPGLVPIPFYTMERLAGVNRFWDGDLLRIELALKHKPKPGVRSCRRLFFKSSSTDLQLKPHIVGLGQSLDDRRRAAVQEDDRHLPLRALATPLRQSQ